MRERLDLSLFYKGRKHMFKTIAMKNYKNEDIQVDFLANAATPLRYKMIFRKDLLTQFANAKSDDNEGKIRLDIDFLPELAFIMAQQAKAAEKKDVNLATLTLNDYVEWLEDFESFSFEMKAEEILDVYYGNAETTSTAKKNNDEQTEI